MNDGRSRAQDARNKIPRFGVETASHTASHAVGAPILSKLGAKARSGLARNFFYAGARALLVSHWAVASDAATTLTTTVFASLAADPKLGRAEALRRAMVAFLSDTARPMNAYPAFWGPFSIVGEGVLR